MECLYQAPSPKGQGFTWKRRGKDCKRKRQWMTPRQQHLQTNRADIHQNLQKPLPLPHTQTCTQEPDRQNASMYKGPTPSINLLQLTPAGKEKTSVLQCSDTSLPTTLKEGPLTRSGGQHKVDPMVFVRFCQFFFVFLIFLFVLILDFFGGEKEYKVGEWGVTGRRERRQSQYIE